MPLLQLLKTNVKLVVAVLITASVAGYITSWTKQSQLDQYIEEYEQFEKDLKRMKKKYPFIKLKKKNYHQEVVDMLSGKTVKDDTSSKNIDGTDKPKFKKSYQSTKQIDI